MFFKNLNISPKKKRFQLNKFIAIYCISLILTAACLINAAIELQNHYAHIRTQAREINLFSRQRMLCEQICKDCYLLKLSNSANARAELRIDLPMWQNVQKNLITGSSSMGLSGINDKKINHKLNALAFEQKKVLEAVSRIMANPLIASTISLYKSEMNYMQGMDSLIFSYDSKAAAEASKYRHNQWYNFIFITLILIFNGLFVFRNSFKRLMLLQSINKQQTVIYNALQAEFEEAKLEFTKKNEEILQAQVKFQELKTLNSDLEEKIETLNEDLDLNKQTLQQTNQIMEHTSKRFQELFQGLPIASCSFDPTGMIYEWNRECERTFGYKSENAFQNSIWKTILRPEEHEEVRKELEQVFSGQTISDVERIMIDCHGTEHSMICNTIPLKGPNDTVSGAVSIFLDITERKEAEIKLMESEKFINQMAKATPDILYVYDLVENKSVYSNRELYSVLGFSEEEFEQLGTEFLTSVIHPKDIKKYTFNNTKKFNKIQEGDFLNSIYRLKSANGDWRWYSSRDTVFKRKEDGTPLQILGLACDITERKLNEERLNDEMKRTQEFSQQLESRKKELEIANEQLERLATLDGLTGLKNHRAFQERLEEEVRRSARFKTPLSVVLLDVDKFKTYNDTFGHPAGDAVLKQVAQLLQLCARKSDFVARYGGEEFIVILPHTDVEGAMILANRFKNTISEAPWEKRPITASFGVASFSMEIKSSLNMIKLADKALYHSKESGRDRVTHINELIREDIPA